MSRILAHPQLTTGGEGVPLGETACGGDPLARTLAPIIATLTSPYSGVYLFSLPLAGHSSRLTQGFYGVPCGVVSAT